MKKGRVWLLFLTMLLWTSFPILAQSETAPTWSEELEPLVSEIQLDWLYEGWQVRDTLLEVIQAGEAEILRAAQEGAEAGAAEATRQLLPEIVGLKAAYNAAVMAGNRDKILWGIGGVVVGGIVGATIVFIVN